MFLIQLTPPLLLPLQGWQRPPSLPRNGSLIQLTPPPPPPPIPLPPPRVAAPTSAASAHPDDTVPLPVSISKAVANSAGQVISFSARMRTPNGSLQPINLLLLLLLLSPLAPHLCAPPVRPVSSRAESQVEAPSPWCLLFVTLLVYTVTLLPVFPQRNCHMKHAQNQKVVARGLPVEEKKREKETMVRVTVGR